MEHFANLYNKISYNADYAKLTDLLNELGDKYETCVYEQYDYTIIQTLQDVLKLIKEYKLENEIDEIVFSYKNFNDLI